MDWQKGRPSDNVEEGSGGGGGGGFIPGGGRGLGLGGLLILLVLSLVFKRDLITPFLGGDNGGVAQQASSQPQDTRAVDCNSPADQSYAFVCKIMGATEDVWSQIFTQKGAQYVPPKLHLFTGSVDTACGNATTAVGPFYCPGDQKVYLDFAFFKELSERFHASGDFANAYVIAHEVGHHVQKLTGVFDQVEQARRRGTPMDGADGLSVRQELQADCFAGVWANHSQQTLQWLQGNDVASALNAASQIGDDKLQEQAQGRVVPDSFTHGTSAQRVKWFKAGLESGDMTHCDTFSGEP